MSPKYVPPGPGQTSFSELSTLARCEQQWWYEYVEGKAHDGTQAMNLGSALGVAIGTVRQEGNLDAALEAVSDDEYIYLSDENITTLEWLLDRYVQHYENDPFEVVELEAELLVPYGDVEFVVHPDEIVRDKRSGELWVLERKSMADWRSLDIRRVSPQETLQAWACRANNIPVVGVLGDYIRTYRWKRDPHPPSDSFKREQMYRDQEQIDGALAWVDAALDRRGTLLAVGGAPVRNLGPFTCNTCDHQDACWTALSFPHDIHLEVVE